MEHNLKIKKNGEATIEVTLSKDDLISFIKQTEERLMKELDVKGFRPGKATKEAIRNKIGEDRIKQEALEFAVESSLAKVLEKEKLEILEQKNLKIKENTPNSLIYQVEILLLPEINLGQYKGIEIKNKAVTVSEEEIEKTLGDLAKSRAIFIETEEPAQKDDKVEIDFEVRDNGEIIEGGKSENHPLIIGEGKFVPGFEDNIIGLKKGENKKFFLKVPDDYFQKSIAGKNLEFEIWLKKVENVSAPKLDDDFAKKLGNFSSFSILKDNIKQGLLLEKEAREKEKKRIELLEKIVKNSEVDIPEHLVEGQLDDMVQDLDSELHQKGMELALYLAHIKKTQEELKKEWWKKAEDQVRKNLVARAIIRAEKIKVNNDELDIGVQEILQRYISSGQGINDRGILENIDIERLKSKVFSNIINEKMFALLENEAKIVE